MMFMPTKVEINRQPSITEESVLKSLPEGWKILRPEHWHYREAYPMETTAIRIIARFATKKRLLLFAVIASTCYIACLVALLLLEDHFLYRSARGKDAVWPVVPVDMDVQDLHLRIGGGVIHARWCSHRGAHGAVLFCHGNAGSIGTHLKPIQAISKELDASVLIFDYPGFGMSEGSPSETGCYAAALAAYDWLAHQESPERIIILGQSLGGGVATELASRRPHRALALFKTFTSFPDVAQYQVPLFPARWLVSNRYDNLDKIRLCGPTFIAHGDCDRLIPLKQAERLFRAAQEPKRLVVLKGYGHQGAITQEVLAALADFLKEVPERTHRERVRSDLGNSSITLGKCVRACVKLAGAMQFNSTANQGY
jgi:pimeloyl-ACP methyl ester carboxylesterase